MHVNAQKEKSQRLQLVAKVMADIHQKGSHLLEGELHWTGSCLRGGRSTDRPVQQSFDPSIG
jgi:hypothetical protein